jgi:hypothetical protein
MATYTEGSYLSRAAGADLSEKQHYVVKLDSSNEVVLASAGSDDILGVLSNAPTEGETAVVRLINSNGTFKVKLGGNVNQGDRLTANSNGEAVATTTEDDVVFGRALLDGSDNDVHEYLCDNDVIPPTS